MRILFLTITRNKGIKQRGIYTDLMRKFRDEGHEVYIACVNERRYHEKTQSVTVDGINILSIWTLNAQKCSMVEKGMCFLLLDQQFKNAIKKYYSNVKFDMVLYATPPITFIKTISYIKKRDGATSYLLLKDIFPQNAVDLGIIKKNGPIYSFFRQKEKALYKISDYIGCLSPANINFLLKWNPYINPAIVEENPNTLEPIEASLSAEKKKQIRANYKILEDAVVSMYGGNLGKPQGIDFILEVLESNRDNAKLHFIIAGGGTEFPKLVKWHKEKNPQNVTIVKFLPKNEYDELVLACDIGLIFLDRRFTIPNFPSRLLSYLENRMPVIGATDVNTDMGEMVTKAGCGFWVESGDLQGFNEHLQQFVNNRSLIESMGEKGLQFLLDNYSVNRSYDILMNRMKPSLTK